MKRLLLSAIALLSVSLPALPASAEPVSATCYMKTSSGQIIDLGVALCGDTPSSRSGDGNAAAFLTELKSESFRRASPDIQSLMSLDSESEQAMVKHANLYCKARRLGSADREIRRSARALALSGSRAGRATGLTFEISSDLAPKYFCPEFAR